ncbi:MAG: hypothetical protein ACYTEQ_19265 [Planctomycetota bacterium]
MSDSEKNRKGDEWNGADVAFLGEVVHMTSTGEVQTYGADEDDVLQADTSQVYEPYGYYSWIPDGTESLDLPKNDEEVAKVGVNVARPTMTAQGEVQVRDSEDNYLKLRSTDGGVILEARSGEHVLLGDSTAAQFVALANLVLTELQAVKTWADAHVHTISVPCSVDPGTHLGTAAGTSAVPTVAMTAPSSVAASKTKAK